MNRKNIIFLALMLVEFGSLVCIWWTIHQKIQLIQSFRTHAVSSIQKNTVSLNPASLLHSYYEPSPNSQYVDTTPWLTTRVEQTFNADTLNENHEYAVEKPKKTFRIIALGDSYTFGDHVSTTENWVSQLETMLMKYKPCSTYDSYEVINLGVKGFDIQNEAERYRLRGQKYTPDLVVWFLIPNDFEDIHELTSDRVNQIYAEQEKTGMLDALNPWGPPVKQAMDELYTKYSHQEILKLQDSFFTRFSSLYTGRLVLMTFPTMDGAYKKVMQQWVVNRKDTWYFDDIVDIFAMGSEALRLKDGHPSVAGHGEIARRVYNYLLANDMFSCAH